MFIPGHVGITLFLAYILALSPIYAAIGVLIPDLLDKPLRILGLAPHSRYIGHTLLGVALSFALAYLITKNRLISFSLSFGYFLHLLEDLPFFIPWFYPFVDYTFPTGAFKFQYTLFAFIFDAIGVALVLYLYRTKPEFRSDVADFFHESKTNFIGRFKKNINK